MTNERELVHNYRSSYLQVSPNTPKILAGKTCSLAVEICLFHTLIWFFYPSLSHVSAPMPELSGINSCINHFSGIPFLRLCFRGNKPVGFCISNIFSNPRVLSFGLQQVKSLEFVSLDLITQAKIPECHLHWGGVPLEVRSHRANGHPNIKRGGDVE